MKRRLIQLAKFAIAAAILAYLIFDASRHQAFAKLIEQPKRWDMLVLATAACFAGLMLTLVRWYYLVRAVGIDISMREALRLGYVGYLFNFVAPGSVGGDLFKAVFLARQKAGQRTEAVASVMVDRLLGLYALFVVAAVAILGTDQIHSPETAIRSIAWMTLGVTVGGAVVIVMLWSPGPVGRKIAEFLSGLRRTGPLFQRLIGAVKAYRQSPGVLLTCGVMSLGVHLCFILGIWLMAKGIPGTVPSFEDQCVIVPLAMVTGAMPITPNGLGTFEFAMDYLYEKLPTNVHVDEGQGTLVAFGYRLITIVIAFAGVPFYLGRRKEMAAAWEEVEKEEKDGEI